MQLQALIRRYADDNDVSSSYEYQLSYAVERFNRHIGYASTTADLSRETVNKWLRSEQESGQLSPRSRKNLRTSIQTIWRFGNQIGHAPPPDQLRPVKVPEKTPEAWTFEELKNVAAAAATLPGHIPNGVPRCWYFPALIWYAFETGLRRSDCFAFDITETRGTRGFRVQRKTGCSHSYMLTEETLNDLRKIASLLKKSGNPQWTRPLRYPGSVSQVYYWMRRSRQIAGVDPTQANRSLQHLRRTGATQVESESQDSAWRYLGHRTGPALARKAYIDQRLVASAIMPRRNRCKKCTQKRKESGRGV